MPPVTNIFNGDLLCDRNESNVSSRISCTLLTITASDMLTDLSHGLCHCRDIANLLSTVSTMSASTLSPMGSRLVTVSLSAHKGKDLSVSCVIVTLSPRVPMAQKLPRNCGAPVCVAQCRAASVIVRSLA